MGWFVAADGASDTALGDEAALTWVGGQVATRSDLVANELKTLRKGRGVSVAKLDERVGPAIRALSGVTEGATVEELRRKVSRRLEELAAELPEDLHIAALVALGLHREAQRPFYQERIRWLADRLQRDERTARRRANEALERLAEIAMEPVGVPLVDQSPSTGVHDLAAGLRVTVYLDTDDPDIVGSVVEGLKEVLKRESLLLTDLAEPELSSWFGRFRVGTRKAFSRAEVAERLHKLEHALEVTVLQRPMSEVNLNQADATERLIHAVANVENAVLLIGSLLLVKITDVDGGQQLFAKTLSVAEVRAFEANQHLLKNPRETLDQLHLLRAVGPPGAELDKRAE